LGGALNCAEASGNQVGADAADAPAAHSPMTPSISDKTTSKATRSRAGVLMPTEVYATGHRNASQDMLEPYRAMCSDGKSPRGGRRWLWGR
ncbi:MAG TPA: hypothetical protein VHW04_16355, partial [Solirubrobacteraceae bacterium]|nr:hypothetical protein [Solirubrobacteraceae bacterium]